MLTFLWVKHVVHGPGSAETDGIKRRLPYPLARHSLWIDVRVAPKMLGLNALSVMSFPLTVSETGHGSEGSSTCAKETRQSVSERAGVWGKGASAMIRSEREKRRFCSNGNHLDVLICHVNSYMVKCKGGSPFAGETAGGPLPKVPPCQEIQRGNARLACYYGVFRCQASIMRCRLATAALCNAGMSQYYQDYRRLHSC